MELWLRDLSAFNCYQLSVRTKIVRQTSCKSVPPAGKSNDGDDDVNMINER